MKQRRQAVEQQRLAPVIDLDGPAQHCEAVALAKPINAVIILHERRGRGVCNKGRITRQDQLACAVHDKNIAGSELSWLRHTGH